MMIGAMKRQVVVKVFFNVDLLINCALKKFFLGNYYYYFTF